MILSKSLTLYLFLVAPQLAFGHFMVIAPSGPILSQVDDKNIELRITFAHPFENRSMDMAPPRKVGVRHHGKTVSLTGQLQMRKEEGNRTYRFNYAVGKPGDYIFFVDPQPYWEPAEQRYIVHQTKVVINVMGVEEGWDEPVGLKAEIQPLTRPYGLWEGNLFTGRVLFKGEPVPGAEVEVTYKNDDRSLQAPSGSHKIQVVKADINGLFSYAMPKAGWWGFAALLEDDYKRSGPDGKSHPVELGALLWVKADPLR